MRLPHMSCHDLDPQAAGSWHTVAKGMCDDILVAAAAAAARQPIARGGKPCKRYRLTPIYRPRQDFQPTHMLGISHHLDHLVGPGAPHAALSSAVALLARLSRRAPPTLVSFSFSAPTRSCGPWRFSQPDEARATRRGCTVGSGKTIQDASTPPIVFACAKTHRDAASLGRSKPCASQASRLACARGRH